MRWKSQGSTLRTTNDPSLGASIFLFCKVDERDEPLWVCKVLPADDFGEVLRGKTWKLLSLPLDCMISKLSDRDEQDSKARCVGSESLWIRGSKPPSPLLLKTGQGWSKCLAGLLPTAHCYPAHEGSHCCASSLSLTTSVNKDLNNKQRNASLCVTVSFTGLSFSSALATLMTRSKEARNGRLISFL